MTFGKLKVLEMDWSARPTYSICKCECGDIVRVRSAQLTAGKTMSCGCLQAQRASQANTKDWTGHISAYGVKMVSQSKMNQSGQWLWECECGLCGTHFDALPAKVANGHITSCGCRR